MPNKTIVVHLLIHNSNETVEFRSDESSEDIRELFRSAVRAGPSELLKLYNHRGSLITISPRTPPNQPSTRYILVTAYAHEGLPNRSEMKAVYTPLDLINKKMNKIEKALPNDEQFIAPTLETLQIKLERLVHKLEGMEHLSWLGLHKDLRSTSRTSSLRLNPRRVPAIRHSLVEDDKLVRNKFKSLAKVQLSTDVREKMKLATFDNWQWGSSEKLMLLKQMFVDLELVHTFNIQMPELCNFLFVVFTKYQRVPFHNFEHCFTVTQMIYALIWMAKLKSKLTQLEILTLLLAALCHDLNHPGFNNSYQINAYTDLAILYNDISPLENHHCAEAFKLLDRKDCGILSQLSKEQFRQLRKSLIKLILSTDLSKHNDHVTAFNAITPNFDYGNEDHRLKLMVMLIKSADVSNECRPTEVALPWLERLQEELFTQGDIQKLEGLPTIPDMDRDVMINTANSCTSQIGFIKVVLLPIFQALARLYPAVEHSMVQPAKQAIDYYYSKMQKTQGEGTAHSKV